MRVYEHPLDYQNIKVYGTLQGWDAAFIRGQQQLAYMLNAPFDTVAIQEDKPILFRDLDAAQRKQFGGIYG